MSKFWLWLYRKLSWRSVLYYAGLIVERAGDGYLYESDFVCIDHIHPYPYHRNGAIKIYLMPAGELVFFASEETGVEVYQWGDWVQKVVDLGRSVHKDWRRQRLESIMQDFRSTRSDKRE